MMVAALHATPCTPFCEKLGAIQLIDRRLPTYEGLKAHFHPLGEQLQHGYPLGTLESLQSRFDCAFCQLVSTVISEDAHDSESQEHGIGPSEPIAVVLFPNEHCFRLSYPSRLGTRLMFVAEAADQLTPAQGPHVAKAVETQKIQPSLVKSWLRKCEGNHDDTCSHVPRGKKPEGKPTWELPNPGQIRLLDLESQCLRRMPLETRYVALSYVWGPDPVFRLLKDNFELLEEKGSLAKIRSDLPNTVNDAIDFVESIDERYLWVDTLCLVQDDAIDLKCGVEIMNSIYQGSYFTMVAGSGVTAYSGIPGINSEPRDSRQTIAQVNKNVKMAAVHSIDWHLNRSVYNKRGWTLQELVLPPRSVIFINNQVYFRCLRANWGEETFADMAPNWLDPDDNNISRIPAAVDGELAAWWTYQKLFEDYSNREVRFEGDALRAVAGILRVLTAGLNSWYLEGIPAYYLDMGLLWISSDGNLNRRENFGSYSWAGWSGRIMWARENYAWPEGTEVSRKPENVFRWIKEKTFVRWHSWEPKGSLEGLYRDEPRGTPSRFARLLEEYAQLLPPHVTEGINNPRYHDYSAWNIRSGSTGFTIRPKFKTSVNDEDRQRVATLFTLELVNSQAELDSLVSKITDTCEILMMYNWQASRRIKSRMYRGSKETFEGRVGPNNRWAKNFIDYRDPESPVVVETGEGDWNQCDDKRYSATKWSNDWELKEYNRPPLKMPEYPSYGLLHFHTISLKLRTGAFPNGNPDARWGTPSAPSAQQSRSTSFQNNHFDRVPGIPLLSAGGELVGSLHLDNIRESAYAPGTEVELVILSKCFLPTVGSALPARQENDLHTSGNVWDMFWVLHVVWKETAIAERRGIGQILDSALEKACGAGPEDKFIMLS